MDFEMLECFIAVAKERSFSRAASYLFMSQQSLSRKISLLESELGIKLFVRCRPLVLTGEGKAFFNTATEILFTKRQFDLNIRSNTYGPDVLVIGISITLARTLLPEVLPKYRALRPNVFIKIIEDSPEALQKSAIYESIDFVIGSFSKIPPAFKTIYLCSKKQLLVTPKMVMEQLFGNNAPKVRQEFSSGADLCAFGSTPFIRMKTGFAAGRIQQSYADYYNLKLKYVCEMINVDVAFQLAVAGIGSLIYSKIFFDSLDSKMRKFYKEYVDIFPLPDVPNMDSYYAYYHKDSHLNSDATIFLNLVKDYFKKFSAEK